MKKFLRVFFAMMLMFAVAPVFAQGNGDGSEANPYTYLWFDDLSINGSKAAANTSDWTYNEVTCRAEGVMEITNNTKSYQIKVLKNGVQLINSIANVSKASILVKMGDVITFKMVSETDQSDKTLDLHWRVAVEGEEWNSALALENGTEIPVVQDNIDLAKWYKFTVAPNCKATLKLGQGVAQVFTADNAATENRGSSFENTEDGMVYTYTNNDNRTLDLYVKVSGMNVACTAELTFSAPEPNKGDGTQENPYILDWDTEAFNATAPGFAQTYFQLESNYEGVMTIDASALVGSTNNDLYINGVVVGKVPSRVREILVNRHDIITFALASEQDNSANAIKISYRTHAEGDIWNMPIALENGTEIAAIVNNVDLAKWYKFSVAPNCKATLKLGYGIAMVYDANTAMIENRGSSFENVEDGMVYTYTNNDNRIVDLYVKVSAMNEACTAELTFSAPETNKGDGTQENPYILDWDTEEFNATAPGFAQTYFQLESNYEGVMTIDASALVGSTNNDLYVNGVVVGKVPSRVREILVNRHDIITFALASEQDNSANAIKISYRSVAQGDVWNMPLALENGTEMAAVENNIDLAKWYRFSVAPNCKATLKIGYGIAMVYDANTAMIENRGSSFENVEGGMVYTYTNNDNRIVDLYVKVSAMNEACTAELTFAAPEPNNGDGSEENPYTYLWFDDLSIDGPAAAASPSSYTYHAVTCRAEGVMEITNNTNAYQIAVIKNGTQIVNSIAKNGVTTSILVKLGDVITFKMISQDDQSDKTVDLHWREVAEGEIWNMPLALEDGTTIDEIKNNIDLAKWYKVTAAPGKVLEVQFNGYASVCALTADEAANGAEGVKLEGNEKGVYYAYDNTENASPVDIYFMVSANNTECTVTVSGTNISTAIKGIFANGDAKVFDLNGRAVKNMQKGKAYIVNGVKVMMK